MMHPIDNQYRYGIVYDLNGQIVGFNLSPNVFVPLTDDDIEKVLENYVVSKIKEGERMDKNCSICKHSPIDEHCKGCRREKDGNTHWEMKELDFSTSKKVVGKLISADVLDKIVEEIQDIMIVNQDEERVYQQIKAIINKYRKEQE